MAVTHAVGIVWSPEAAHLDPTEAIEYINHEVNQKNIICFPILKDLLLS